jgi:hypothetical protein
MRTAPFRRGNGRKMHSEESDPAGRRQIVAGAPLAFWVPFAPFRSPKRLGRRLFGMIVRCPETEYPRLPGIQRDLKASVDKLRPMTQASASGICRAQK